MEVIRRKNHQENFEILFSLVLAHGVPENIFQVQNKIKSFGRKEEAFWKTQAKCHWLREGNINSRYFHAIALGREKHTMSGGIFNAVNKWNKWARSLWVYLDLVFLDRWGLHLQRLLLYGKFLETEARVSLSYNLDDEGFELEDPIQVRPLDINWTNHYDTKALTWQEKKDATLTLTLLIRHQEGDREARRSSRGDEMRILQGTPRRSNCIGEVDKEILVSSLRSVAKGYDRALAKVKEKVAQKDKDLAEAKS
ncbi:hypothetical protein ACFE04_000438 [Oxalis oulophora]